MKQKLFANIKRLTSVFTIAILLITVTILLLRLTIFSNPQTSESNQGASKEPSSSQETLGDPDGMEFKYSISSELRFKNFKESTNPRIKNDSGNTALMQVKIIEEESKASLYESIYIKPGISEPSIKLSGTPLEKGTYKCKAEIIVLDPVSMKELTTFVEDITIIIDESLPEETPSSEESSSEEGE